MSEAVTADRSRAKAQDPAPVAGNSPAAANRITELQVTSHLMTLETGLFCVFQSPGSPPPDPVTSLPGVRITPAPGISGRPEAVSVSTFRDDGWLNGTAALVRVTDGSAQILVTIYQARGRDAAPKLQVLRLTGDATTAAAAPAVVPPVEEATAEVMAHIQRVGDVTAAIGEWIGKKGSQSWVEGFGLAPHADFPITDIEYQAVLGRDWLSPWVEGGKFCGSRGMALPLLGLKIRLKGAAAKAYDLSYSATFVDGCSIGPVDAGETCEAPSHAALESFVIVLQPRDSKATAKSKSEPAPTARGLAAKGPVAKGKPMTALATKKRV